jgi:hypothetical protein
MWREGFEVAVETRLLPRERGVPKGQQMAGSHGKDSISAKRQLCPTRGEKIDAWLRFV